MHKYKEENISRRFKFATEKRRKISGNVDRDPANDNEIHSTIAKQPQVVDLIALLTVQYFP